MGQCCLVKGESSCQFRLHGTLTLFSDVVWWLKWAYSPCHVSLSSCHVQWCSVVIEMGVPFVSCQSVSPDVTLMLFSDVVWWLKWAYSSCHVCLSVTLTLFCVVIEVGVRSLHVTAVYLPVTFSDAVWWLKWAYFLCHVNLSSCHLNAVQWCCVVTEMDVLFVSCQSVFLSP